MHKLHGEDFTLSVAWSGERFTPREMLTLSDLDDGGSLDPIRLAGLVNQAAAEGRLKRGDAELLAAKLKAVDAWNDRQQRRQK